MTIENKIDSIMAGLDADILARADHSNPLVSAVFDEVAARTLSPADAIIRLKSLEALERMQKPTPRTATRVSFGRNDHHSKYVQAATDAILVRDKVMSPRQADPDHTEFMELSLPRMARQCLTMQGITPPPRDELFSTVTAALRTRVERGYSTSDFTSLLENIASKAVTLGWDNAPETWQYWTRQTETKDFKQFSRISAPELPTPQEVVQGGEIPRGSVGSDSAEKSAVKTYAEILDYSREAMTNDDTQRLTITGEAAGRAAARLVGDLAYGVLTTNANMASGNALFSAANSNIVASGSGAAPSATTLNEIRALMSAHTNSGEVLNIRPALMLVPTVLEGTAAVLRDASNSQAEDDPLTPGYKAGRFAVVSDARLDAASSTGWYMCASPRQHSGVDIVSMEGSGGRPTFENVQHFARDGIAFRIKHDVVALPVDYRTMCFNFGS